MLRPRIVAAAAALVAVGELAASGPAEAAGSKEAQAQKALREALDEDYLETRFDAAEQKLRAAIQTCGKACSAALRAKLHVALGAVLATGKKELDDARDELADALTLDPKVQLNPDLLSTEVKFAWAEARKKLGLASGGGSDAKPSDRTEKAKPPPPPDKDAPDPDAAKEPPAPAEPIRKNWISLSFSPDLAVVSGSDVCTPDSQNGAHYVCLRADGSRYDGHPTLGNGDNVNAGIALATMRVMLGYDRVVHTNLTVGARIGFAFNGASGGGSSFLPLHVEGRFGVWPGHDPFVGTGVRPFFMLSGGVAQMDAKVKVQVLEDGTQCGAVNPTDTSSPCTKNNSSGVPEARQQTLTVYKQDGLGFAALAFGVQFAPSTRVALHLALRGTVSFPSVAGIISPEGGIAVGF